jgi:hypothetical protein
LAKNYQINNKSMGKEKNFGSKQATSTFRERKKDINREGRPKKNYTVHINELKAQGYEPPTRTEYFDMLGMLLIMKEADLKTFAEDKEKPFWVRLIMTDLNNKSIRHKLMSDYRDWLYGRATQEIDITQPIIVQFKEEE